MDATWIRRGYNRLRTCGLICQKMRLFQSMKMRLQSFAILSVWNGLLPAILIATAWVSALHAEDWPRWGGSRGDETWQGPKLPATWPTDGLPVTWKREIGGGYGGVSVSSGRVYVMDRVKEPAEVERVHCFDSTTGKSVWTHEYPVAYGKLGYGNGPRATPTIFDGKVYAFGAVGHLHCLDAARGTVIWSKDFVRDFGAKLSEWGTSASPLIWEDLVIVHPGVPDRGSVMAFDRLTGKEVWRASNDPAGYATPTVIASPSGPQLICWTPEHILSIAPRTGAINWSSPYKVTYGVSIATPIYHKGIVFITGYWEGSKAIRLGAKPDDAKLIWEDNRNLRGLMAQPLYRDGYVYSIDKVQGLTCFELETGKKLWDEDHKVTARGHNPHASFVWLGDGDRVIILNEGGQLILARINSEGYHEQSRTKIIANKDGRPIWAHPAYAGTAVYARSETELICVSLVSPVQKEKPTSE